MATYSIYKLRFTSPLHIGYRKNNDYGISMKTIASDTLYAALTSCLAKVGVQIPNDGDLGFAVSCLFPFFQETGKKAVLFMPMPMHPLAIEGEKSSALLKKVKKVHWVDADLYDKVLRGTLSIGSDETVRMIRGEYLTNENIDETFVSSQVTQRVKIESRTGDDNALPYYVDLITFKEESGLYFIACGDTELLDKGMNLLSMEGIGTDRNVGNGFFEFCKETLELDTEFEAHHAVSLSMFIPESKKQIIGLLDSKRVAYDFERRGGWITTYPHNMLRKNVVYAFTAGSVFHCELNCATTMGSIVDLKPSAMKEGHPIWRCGKAIFLPLK